MAEKMKGSGKAEQRAARGARLAAALRENLKRRKAQARSRAEEKTAAPRGNAAGGLPAPDFRRNRGCD